MQNRQEIKFAVPKIYLQPLIDDIKKIAEFDKYCINGMPYLVSSKYFDNNKMDSYYSKIKNPINRYKIRTRSYLTHSKFNINFEIKLNRNGIKSKTSSNISDILSSEMPVNENIISQHIISSMISTPDISGFQKPIVSIEYERLAFQYNKWLRLTIDNNIRIKNEFTRGQFKKLIIDYSILELKNTLFNGWPTSISSLLKKYSLIKINFSKYERAVSDTLRI